MKNKVIDINKRSFVSIVIMLEVLVILAIAITYIIPKGTFRMVENEEGEMIFDYTNYDTLPDQSGINIFKGLFAFVLVLFSKDGLSLIMLSLFLLVIAGAFQIMNDTSGMYVLVQRLVNKFKNKKHLLICLLTLVFMCFGAFLGLFEEVLTMLPLIVMITISLGYDGFLGFLVCIVATGFGFSCALTNPFTVLTASEIIGASPMAHLWFRILVFIIMYGLLLLFIFYHIKKIDKTPELSPTYDADLNRKSINKENQEVVNEKKVFKTYVILLTLILLSIITVTSIPMLRGFTVVFLIAIFLIGGILSGIIITGNIKMPLTSFVKGMLAAMPTILLVLLASSIKYILEEGMVLATIGHSISTMIDGKNSFIVAIMIYVIILFLEFFISSSTAKSIFVMGILSFVNISLSKELLVLIYLFGDGFTNVLFPTSPVLLIGLSMIGMNYFTWIKKSKWLFLVNTIIVVILILLAVLMKY